MDKAEPEGIDDIPKKTSIGSKHKTVPKDTPENSTNSTKSTNSAEGSTAESSADKHLEPAIPDIMKGRKALRQGYTTGTCASAAAKAAIIGLSTGQIPENVSVTLPAGRIVELPVELTASTINDDSATAVVIKDAGDDPDCTNGAWMTATVTWTYDQSPTKLLAGPGIGTVTMEGLGIPVGEPAITPIPKRMILSSLEEVTPRPVMVTFTVPGGDTMAKETTNERLGIIGGISILGTTGIVKPFSTAAYRASILRQIDVASARGFNELVLCIGSRSEKAAMKIFSGYDPVLFVEVGDFTGAALKQAVRRNIQKVSLVAMMGKITKLAAGTMMTHFHKSNVNTTLLYDIAMATHSLPEIVKAATDTSTARHFYEVCIAHNYLPPLQATCELARQECLKFIDNAFEMHVHMVDFDSGELVATDHT